MAIDIDNLRRHYAELSDDALLEIDPGDLVEAARECYEKELAQREMAGQGEESGTVERLTGLATEGHADWLQDAACACSFQELPGGSAAADAETARQALEGAGIPCQVSMYREDPPDDEHRPRSEYRVMVPGALTLHATSVLDTEIFNPQMEAEWRGHFESLSDEDLGLLDPQVFCAGLLDRVQRLKKAYSEEIARRKTA